MRIDETELGIDHISRQHGHHSRQHGGHQFNHKQFIPAKKVDLRVRIACHGAGKQRTRQGKNRDLNGIEEISEERYLAGKQRLVSLQGWIFGDPLDGEGKYVIHSFEGG